MKKSYLCTFSSQNMGYKTKCQYKLFYLETTIFTHFCSAPPTSDVINVIQEIQVMCINKDDQGDWLAKRDVNYNIKTYICKVLNP